MGMNATPFYNFHTHTHYSVKDAVMTPKNMVEALHERGHKYAALTEHGTLGSSYELWKECRERDMTPCLGCECYFVDSYEDPGANVPWNYGHITVVATSQQGWLNLKILHDIAWRVGFKVKPRIQLSDLCKYNEGLIITTGCMRGPVGYDLLGNDKFLTGESVAFRKARINKRIGMLKKAFGPRLFGEVQLLELPEQVTVNKYVRKLAKKYDFPVIVTGDTHYLCKKDTDIHDAVICIGRKERIDDPTNSTYPTNQLWLKMPSELERARKKWHKYISKDQLREYIKNTHIIAALVENYELRPEGSSLPFVTKTPKRDARALMKTHPQYRELMKKPEYKARLKYEMEVITRLGFLDYFLMFDDILKYCRERGIAYNARGSVCGSLVAYFMAITWIDPVVFRTPFERFLTSDRLSLPDIDMDLCSANRTELVSFCEEKYGQRNVVYIGTSTTYKPKALFKDLLKIHGFDFQFANRLTKPVDDKVDTWEEFSINPAISKFLAEHEDINNLGPRMMGLIKNAGIHASGIVVTPTPCVDWLPVAFRTDKGDEHAKTKKLRAITEWDHNMLEDLDILKLDFLGVNQLDVVSLSVKNIAARHKTKFKDYQELHMLLYADQYSDKKVYEAIATGNTIGTFQLGTSDGMRELGKDLVPTNIYDIMAMISLYRTAILKAGMHAQYVSRRNGEPYKYAHEKMAEVLDHTYGVLIYQEDVMALSVKLAGFTPMEADHFRQGIKSKDKRTFAKWKGKFLSGCQSVSQMRERDANNVWGFMEKFSGYGFNSSHAASYAVLAYMTCWLKENYPTEYIAALLSCNADNDERVSKYLSVARKSNIATLPPCVNRSTNEFKIGKGTLRYPLQAVKGLGEKAVDSIDEARKDGPFKSFEDFLERINRRVCNIGIIQKLALAGALSKFGSKEKMFDVCMKMRAKNDKVFRQLVCLTCQCRYPISLKWEAEEERGGAACPNCAEQHDIVYWEGNVPSKKKYRKLKFDKRYLQQEAFGYTTGGSRLSEFSLQIAEQECDDMADVDHVDKETMMTVAFEIKKVKKHTDKNGNQMAFIDITDGATDTSIIMFASSWSNYSEFIASGRCYIGKLSADGGKFLFADRRGSFLQLLAHKAQ